MKKGFTRIEMLACPPTCPPKPWRRWEPRRRQARSAFTLVEMLACQPKPWRRQARSAFTLVEMLVVIAILGILMAMMVPAAGLILKRVKISSARGDANVVASVLLKYQMEYNRWPATYDAAAVNVTDLAWVSMMTPQPGSGAVPTNPKRIVFFEAGGGALEDDVSSPHVGAFVDPWGNPFHFQLNQTGTDQMVNPNVDVGGKIRAGALAWSAGPDEVYDTWNDNVAGWE